MMPGIKEKGLKGSIRYYDGKFDDARLAINIAQTAMEKGASLLNYTKVIGLLKSGDTVVMDKDGYFYFKGRGDAVLKYKGIKLNCIEMIKKLNVISNVNRSHLLIDCIDTEKQLIVCVEVDKRSPCNDALTQAIHMQFSSLQKPDHIYITDRFPSLSNGKLDVHALEKIATQYVSSCSSR